MGKGAPIQQGVVRAMAGGGESVVDTGEGVVLVRGGWTGETVRFVETAKQRGARRGRLIHIDNTSSQRRPPPCHVASTCGGCPWMHVTESAQQHAKLAMVKDACGTDRVSMHAARPTAYRRRARLAWHGSTFGYRAAATGRVVDVDQCLVLRPELEAAWARSRECLRGVLKGHGELWLAVSTPGNAVVALATELQQPTAAFVACEKLSCEQGIAGVQLRIGADAKPAAWGETAQQVPGLRDAILHAAPDAFVQANDEINMALVNAVEKLAAVDGMRVLELYCGVGNFTLPLAGVAKALTALELDPDAAAHCRNNLKANGRTARVVTADASVPPDGSFDVVVLDPPRSGARKALTSVLAHKKQPKRIVYVSCEPTTLKRDITLCAEHGYTVAEARAFDMFPQTAHVETVVLLTPA